MDGNAAMSEGLSLNILLIKERENVGMSSVALAQATKLLIELTGDEGLAGKPGLEKDDRERKEPPLMGGIHELQKLTDMNLSILGDRLEQIHRVLFGK